MEMMHHRLFSLVLYKILLCCYVLEIIDRYEVEGNVADNDSKIIEYGVDISFPMHHFGVSTNYPWLPHNNMDPTVTETPPPQYQNMPLQPLGDRQKFYDNFLQSCVDYFNDDGGSRCYESEKARIEKGLLQPQSMQNYTEMGFAKIRAPDNVYKLLQEFWETNKDNVKPEEWARGETVTNNWQSPTGFVGLEDTNLTGGGVMLQHMIWGAARQTIEEWTQQELAECSLYGIRVYYEGSILAPHVDRLPLVSSAVIQVAQDVDEPWPLEVIGHDGKAYNVTMVPGDMVLYESHSVLHGRPFPLKGRFVANVFVHFEPKGQLLRHSNASKTDEERRDSRGRHHIPVTQGVGSHAGDTPDDDEDAGILPSYVIPGSPLAFFIKENPSVSNFADTKGTTIIHHAAQMNDLKSLQQALELDKSLINTKDENGWTALHEAASDGLVEIVKCLLENGADMNILTGDGESVLRIAETSHGSSHPVVELLRTWGTSGVDPDHEL